MTTKNWSRAESPEIFVQLFMSENPGEFREPISCISTLEQFQLILRVVKPNPCCNQRTQHEPMRAGAKSGI